MTAARSTLISAFLGLAFAACGGPEGPRWHGTIEHEGVTVEYETYYYPPSLIERFNNSDGIAARVAVGGQTMALTPGVGHPSAWSDRGDAGGYTQQFWGEVAAKFKATVPAKGHEDEHHLILSHLELLRDVQRTLPADFGARKDALTLAEDPAVPVITAGPDEKLTTDEEDAYSREVGRQVVEAAKAEREKAERERSSKFWSSDALDIRKAKNRGARYQHSESGYEYMQRLELWKSHTMLTRFDHSATRAYTYRRLKGSNDPWQLLFNGSVDSCNHGDCPEIGNMRHYETCDSGAVSDWYGLDGECIGNWFTEHLCNDDTSMQINNAQGIWTGNRCPGALRGIAPRCGRQFK